MGENPPNTRVKLVVSYPRRLYTVIAAKGASTNSLVKDLNTYVNVIFLGGFGMGVMVWAGISYGQLTQLHFMDGNLNAQKYCDEILGPIVMPFTRRHCLVFQHDIARIDLYDSVFQFPPISRNFTQPLKRSGTTFHRPKSTV